MAEPAKRIPAAPNLDGANFEKPLREAFPNTSGTPKAVYNGQLPKFLQWLRGDGAYEGSGVKDTVNAHAVQLDSHKNNIDVHAQTLAELELRTAALEAAPPATPFP